jgi:hypothetical protein
MQTSDTNFMTEDQNTRASVISPREWLVIESSYKNAVFAPDDAKKPRGYIPRDVAEKLLGRDLGGNVWFTREDSDKMRSHPEWTNTEPPGRAPVVSSEMFESQRKLDASVTSQEAAEYVRRERERNANRGKTTPQPDGFINDYD